jgi:uroporphyrinogen-III decarboxylase
MINRRKDYHAFQAGAKLLADALARDKTPERVPIYAQLHEFAMHELGVTARAFYTTPELLIYGALEITETYGIDVPYADYDVYNIEAEALGQALIWDDAVMPDVDRDRPLITGPADLDKIRTPDFDSAGRCAMIIEAQQMYLDATGLQPTLNFCAPFSFVANIRGTENLLFDMMLNPTFARDLFDRAIEEVLAPWILYQKAYFPAATNIVGSDASASVPILNPGMIQAWIVPDISRLRALCGPEIYVPNWVGEALLPEPEKMLDLKRQVAADFIEGQDPDVEVLGPERYLAYAQKHDLALLLGVGAAFMDASSPEAVADRVRHYIEVGKQHDRFAIFFCNLGATTPPENIRVAVETARSYGCYG